MFINRNSLEGLRSTIDIVLLCRIGNYLLLHTVGQETSPRWRLILNVVDFATHFAIASLFFTIFRNKLKGNSMGWRQLFDVRDASIRELCGGGLRSDHVSVRKLHTYLPSLSDVITFVISYIERDCEANQYNNDLILHVPTPLLDTYFVAVFIFCRLYLLT